MIRTVEFTADEDLPDGIRADRYLSEIKEILSRSQLKSRLVGLTINGREEKLSRKVAAGDRIVLTYDDPPEPTHAAEDIPLDILYEDDDVVVVDKPRGMVVHPAAGNHTGTLVQGLMYRYRSMTSDFGEGNARPGIVHRLDKDTSGVIIAAKSPEVQRFLADQFKKKSTAKKYLAVVRGRMPETSGTIGTLLARDPRNRKRFTWKTETGKKAVTRYRVLRQYAGYAFVLALPETGRTHQIRVHLLSTGHPVLGDPVYGRRDHLFPGAGLMLHAYSLTMRIPGREEPVTFRSPLPDDMKRVLRDIAALPEE